jgi:hypothetical protein
VSKLIRVYSLLSLNLYKHTGSHTHCSFSDSFGGIYVLISVLKGVCMVCVTVFAAEASERLLVLQLSFEAKDCWPTRVAIGRRIEP